MMQQVTFQLPSARRGFHLVTDQIVSQLNELPNTGMLNIFIHHTSAALSINENADPSVRSDMNSFTNHLIPENWPGYTHTYEGPDDMPAHIKSSLYGASLNIPIINGRLGLGTWQGIYLCEFRGYGGSRRITLTVME